MKSDRRFYVYVHRRKTDGRVFYVGKGCGGRANNTTHRSVLWKRVYKKHGMTIGYAARNIPEVCALSLEMAIIAAHGRKNLTNLSDGGEGVSNPSQSQRIKKSIAFSGLNNPAYDGKVYSFWNEKYGTILATKQKMRTIFGIGSSALSRVEKGTSISAKGWMLSTNKGKTAGVKCGPNNSTKKTIETYRNISGDTWTGNPHEFSKVYNLNKTNVYKMRTGRKTPYKGWALA